MTFNYETVIDEVTELSGAFFELYKLTCGLKYLCKSGISVGWLKKINYKNDWLYQEYETFSKKVSTYVSDNFDVSVFIKELNTFIGNFESLYVITLDSVSSLNYKVDFDTLEIHEAFIDKVHGAKDLVITLKLHLVEEEEKKAAEEAAAKQAEEDAKKAAEEEAKAKVEAEAKVQEARKKKRDL